MPTASAPCRTSSRHSPPIGAAARGWRLAAGEHPHEASLLTLDATRARAALGWEPLLAFDDAVAWTADWYQAFRNGDDVGAVTRAQIGMFAERLARAAGNRT